MANASQWLHLEPDVISYPHIISSSIMIRK